MALLTLRYVGPHAEGVDSVDLGYVPHDVPIDVDQEIAQRLLQQPDNWAVDKPASAAKKGNS